MIFDVSFMVSCRPKEYACLMTWIDAHDFAMETTIGDAELLVFSSTQLIVDSQSELYA